MIRNVITRSAMAAATAVFGWFGAATAQDNVFVLPIGNNPPQLNRLLTTDISASVFSYVVFDTLVVQDPDYVPQPKLATAWEANSDSTEFRFDIREGVTFHNGEAMTADDVAFTLQTYLPLAPQVSFLKTYIEDVSAPDDTTVVVKLNQPFAPFVAAMAGIPIVPRSVFGDGQDVTTHPANLAPVGTGPFKLVSYDQGERIVLTRNDEYWGNRPEIDTIVMPIIPDQNARILAFEGGDIDFLYGSLVDKARYTGLNDRDGVFSTRQGGGVNTLTVHTNARSGPLAEFAVRRALYQAINRDMLAERAYYGFGKPARGPVPAVIGWAASPEVDYREALPFDPEAAAAALDEAGYPVGADGKRFSLNLIYISGYGVLEAASNVIKANLAEIGVDVSISGNEFGLWSERTYTQHDFDMSIVFYTSYQDPSIGVARVYLCNPDNVLFRNASGICDPEVDAAFAKAGSVPDLDQRRDAFAKAETMILDLMNSYPLVDDPAMHFGRGDRWDFSAAFANEPADWSLVTRID